jgi:hypothetical protein
MVVMGISLHQIPETIGEQVEDGCSEAVLIISSYSLPETGYLGSRIVLWGYLYITGMGG